MVFYMLMLICYTLLDNYFALVNFLFKLVYLFKIFFIDFELCFKYYEAYFFIVLFF